VEGVYEAGLGVRRPEDIPGIDKRHLQLYGPFESLRDVGRLGGIRDAMEGAHVCGKYVDIAVDRVSDVLDDEEKAELVAGLMDGYLTGLRAMRGEHG
jgi:hypothetical protein